MGERDGEAQTVRRAPDSILRERVWAVQVPDLCWDSWKAESSLGAEVGGVHVPPDGPVRHQCAEDKYGLCRQLSCAKGSKLKKKWLSKGTVFDKVTFL